MIRHTLVDLPKPAEGKHAVDIWVPELYRRQMPNREPSTAISHMRWAFDDPEKGVFRNKADVVVFDLRLCDQGSYTETVFSNLLTPKAFPFYNERARNEKRHRQNPQFPIWEGPIVILTSRLTAGPAELFAMGLKSHNRALIIGEPTRGIGATQSVFDVEKKTIAVRPPSPLGILRLTTVQLFEFDGTPIQLTGLVPHVSLPWLVDPEHRLDQGPNPQPATPNVGPSPVKFEYQGIDAATIKTLVDRSMKRQAESPAFKKHLDDIAEFRTILARRTEGVTRAELAKLSNLRALDATRIRRLEETSGTERDFYADEVFAIVGDLVGSMKK
jgi:carboxyl-terminal processing protease